MKAVIYRGGTAVLSDVLPAVPAPGEALVSVRRTGMCGTDLGIVQRGRPQAVESVTLGHEVFGQLADGTRVVIDPFVTCGRCVACGRGDTNLCEALKIIGVHSNGGFAHTVVVPVTHIVPVPDTVTDAQASLVEPLATALHAWRRAEANAPRTVGIIGAGAIGQAITAVCVFHGVAVEVADVDPDMLDHARRQGAVRTGTELCGSYDVVFECVGLEGTRQQAAAVTRPGGTVVMVGLADPQISLAGRLIVTFERTIRGSFGYRHQDFVDAVAIASQVHTGWIAEYALDEMAALLTGEIRLPDGTAKAQYVSSTT